MPNTRFTKKKNQNGSLKTGVCKQSKYNKLKFKPFNSDLNNNMHIDNDVSSETDIDDEVKEEDKDNELDEYDEEIPKKRIRKKSIIFEPDTSPTYKYKSRTNKVTNKPNKIIHKSSNKIILKNKITPRKQFSQLEKDLKLHEQDNKCNMCFKFIGLEKEFDHVIPRCLEGKDKYVNMQYLCIPCHKFKTIHLDRQVIKPMVNNMKGHTSNDFINLINEIKKVQRKERYECFDSY